MYRRVHVIWFSIPIQLWIGSFAPRFIQNTYKNHIFILDCDSLPWDFHWRESGENLHGLNSSQLTLIACGKSMNLRSHCRKISLTRICSPFFFSLLTNFTIHQMLKETSGTNIFKTTIFSIFNSRDRKSTSVAKHEGSFVLKKMCWEYFTCIYSEITCIYEHIYGNLFKHILINWRQEH